MVFDFQGIYHRYHLSGQIIATSHDLTPKGSFLEGKSPAISGKSRLVKYYSIWPDLNQIHHLYHLYHVPSNTFQVSLPPVFHGDHNPVSTRDGLGSIFHR